MRITFSFQEDLDRTDQLALAVVPAGPGVNCTDLRTAAETGTIPGAELAVARRPVCDFNRRFTIEGVSEGLKYFVVYGVNATGTVVVTGCREQDVFANTEPLTITLAATRASTMDPTDHPTRSCP